MGWLSRGARGDNVRNVQGLLWQAGLYDGAIDGSYGMKTESAVKKWQSEIGAVSDGHWGIKTIIASSKFLNDLNNSDAVTNGAYPVVPTLGGKGTNNV
jgi:peptidoglycan hydrolase-like protein with peptidoglycan-binding domain